jgi:hypothetical protein
VGLAAPSPPLSPPQLRPGHSHSHPARTPQRDLETGLKMRCLQRQRAAAAQSPQLASACVVPTSTASTISAYTNSACTGTPSQTLTIANDGKYYSNAPFSNGRAWRFRLAAAAAACRWSR